MRERRWAAHRGRAHTSRRSAAIEPLGVGGEELVARARRRGRRWRRRTPSRAGRTSRASRRRGSCSRTCSGPRRTSRGSARSRAAAPCASIEWSGIANPDSLQWTLSPSAASAEMPRFQSANSSGVSDRGQPACSTTTVRSAQVGQRRRRRLELVGVRHQLEHEIRARRARAGRRRSGRRSRRPSAGCRGTGTTSSARRASRSMSAMGSVGTMPPMMASGCPVAVGHLLELRGSRRPSRRAVAAATCTNFTTFQFADSEK